MPKKSYYIGSNSSCLVLIFALTPETFEYCIIQIQQYSAVRVLLWVNKGANASALTLCVLLRFQASKKERRISVSGCPPRDLYIAIVRWIADFSLIKITKSALSILFFLVSEIPDICLTLVPFYSLH